MKSAKKRWNNQPPPNLLPVYAYYVRDEPITMVDDIERLSAWPEGSCTFGWMEAPDGSWTCWSTSSIFGGRYHGKFLTGYFIREGVGSGVKWTCTTQVASTRKLAKQRAQKFWVKHQKRRKR